MKYRLNEEQLNSLIAESTMRILREASEDEGIGSALGTGLGWLARKTANGFQQFGQNFRQQFGGQQGQTGAPETPQQNLTKIETLLQQLGQEVNTMKQAQATQATQNTQPETTAQTSDNPAQPTTQTANNPTQPTAQTTDNPAQSQTTTKTKKTKKVSLKESQLNKMIMESIKRLLSERDWRFDMMSDGDKRFRQQPKQQVSESRINKIVSETINKVLKDLK